LFGALRGFASIIVVGALKVVDSRRKLGALNEDGSVFADGTLIALLQT